MRKSFVRSSGNVVLASWCLAVAWTAAPAPALAGEIVEVNRPECRFLLKGEIDKGDVKRVHDAGIKGGDALCLDSDGGSFVAGLDLAESFLLGPTPTVVGKGARCDSACAIAFMGGTRDIGEDVPVAGRKMHVTARIGFHAPYLLPRQGTFDGDTVRTAYAVGLNSVARMMTLGAGPRGEGYIKNRIILQLLEKGPDEVFLVDKPLIARQLDIEVYGAPAATWGPREACNACVNVNLGAAAGNSCDANALANAKITPVSHDTTQMSFAGFGGEAMYQCFVRVTRGAKGVTATLAPLVSETEAPPKASAFRPASDVDALSSLGQR